MWFFSKPKEEIRWGGYGKYQYCKKCKKVFGPSIFDVQRDGVCGKCGNDKLIFVVARFQFKVKETSLFNEVLDFEIKKYLKG